MTAMQATRTPKIALVGNPNSGKSTLFNLLTGLRQKTGNFPGVTVDIKTGRFRLPDGQEVELTDLPGAYSLYPTSADERIVAAVFSNPSDPHHPDAVVYVADVTHLEKHLLLLTQLLDLRLPILLALNMADAAEAIGLKVNTAKLAEKLGVPVVLISSRTGENLSKLLLEIEKLLQEHRHPSEGFYPLDEQEKNISEAIRLNAGADNPYRALLLAHHHAWLPDLSEQTRQTLSAITSDKQFNSLKHQVDETLERYDRFTPIVQATVQHPPRFPSTTTDRIDAILTHRWFGPVIFGLIMLLIFQAIYDWSSIPMDFIESSFAWLSNTLRALLPEHWATRLLTDGILTGLSGILVFVPQIAILFFLITLLEEVGYMARVVFMFDQSMRRFGMGGRSIVSLISGGACAVPAIMSSRTIGNWKERLITILVTPFITCSARIPVYVILIGLVVPAQKVLGVFSLQGLTFASMYALGVFAALSTGYILKKIMRTRERSYLALELPVYRMPHWRNLWLTVWEKVSAFVFEAGRIILIISIVLWASASFGPGSSMDEAKARARTEAAVRRLSPEETESLIAAYQLEASYAGRIGKAFEPVIRPLGYDWKIGIALFTSFAAREVFAGTLAVLYQLGDAEADITDAAENPTKATLRQRMRDEKFIDTGKPVYTLATALSLLVFYALAMQCASTLAVVRRETGSWKWPLLQFAFMTLLAYAGAWVVYNLFI
ncbi:MAG: ferrous iron transport protein B [Saprospiraceae bacterium]|nr:ferrous iron transport protein B [Saprospiraceae bacterium]MDW8228932.1 ferrous iron transport protein B [Saprospiraceae bacterium]